MAEFLHQRYRIVRPLGQGGAGQSYLGHDTAQDRSVVIKELYTAVGADDPRVREAEMLRRLDHPQVPKLLDAFVEPVRGVSRLHLVMEHVQGHSLAEGYEARRPTVDEVVADVDALLGILADLQALAPPILHRDIKPANVLKRPDGSLVLIDFGLATDGVEKTLGHTMVAGTLGFQAPEQIAGSPTLASDVYSVGVLAWSLLANRPPTDRLAGQGLDGWARDVASAPPWLQVWLGRALAPVGERFPDAAAALAALRARQVAPSPRASAAPKASTATASTATASTATASTATASTAPASTAPDAPPPSRGRWASPGALASDGARWVLAFAIVPVALGVIVFWQGWDAPSPGQRAAPRSEDALTSRLSCADDDADACFREAMRQIDEEQPPQIGAAVRFADRACELGSSDGCAWLGRTWGEGIWFTPNPDKALRYTAAACQLNATNTCDRLIDMLSRREATRDDDIFRILQQWELDCRNLEDPLQDPWTCQVLLWWHGRSKPWGAHGDLTRILPAAERLCDAGHTDSCLQLAHLVEGQEPERAHGLYERLCAEDPGDDFDAQRRRRTACQGASRLEAR